MTFTPKTKVKLNKKGLIAISQKQGSLGLKDEDISEKTGIKPTTIRRILKGTYTFPDTLEKISHVLNFPLENYVTIYKGPIIQSASDISSITSATQELSEAATDDVQGIASAQIKILDNYHKEVLRQAKNSFRWALITSATGFFFFLTSVIFVVYKEPKRQALIPLISGAVIELIAAVNFYLYGQATRQLSSFHNKLDQTQRYLLANSMCESLNEETKNKSRAELIKTVSTLNSSD